MPPPPAARALGGTGGERQEFVLDTGALYWPERCLHVEWISWHDEAVTLVCFPHYWPFVRESIGHQWTPPPPPPPPHKWPVMRGFDVLFIVSGNTVLPGVCALTWHYCNASFFLWFAAIILSVFANSWDAYTHICQSCVTGIHWQRWHTPERYW